MESYFPKNQCFLTDQLGEEILNERRKYIISSASLFAAVFITAQRHTCAFPACEKLHSSGLIFCSTVGTLILDLCPMISYLVLHFFSIYRIYFLLFAAVFITAQSHTCAFPACEKLHS